MDLDAQNAARVTALVDALPPVIRIGAFDIAILLYRPNQHERAKNFGHFSAIEHKIYIDPSRSTPFQIADTFLHETMHAIWWASNLGPDEDSEESVVSAFSAAFVDLHRNNRWLAPWLTMATAPVEAKVRAEAAPPICDHVPTGKAILAAQGYLLPTDKEILTARSTAVDSMRGRTSGVPIDTISILEPWPSAEGPLGVIEREILEGTEKPTRGNGLGCASKTSVSWPGPATTSVAAYRPGEPTAMTPPDRITTGGRY